MKICRACLVTENNMNLMDEFSVNSFNLLTNLDITLSDGMPKYLCQNCGQLVKLFVEFRDKALSSETTLRKFTEEGKSDEWLANIDNIYVKKEDEEISNVIKKEIKLEIEYEEKQEESSIIYSLDAFDSDNFAFCEPDDIEEKKNKKPRKNKIIKKETITEHSKQPSSLSCGLCKKQFECKDTLVTHLESHKKVGISECGICGEKSSNWSQQLSHRLLHIPSKERCCHICGKRYVSPVYLEHHYLTSHFEGQEKRLKCKICNRMYDTPRKLNKHKWSVHAQVKYICDYCSKSFITKTVLRVHMRSHMDNKTYVCDLCGFSCKQSHSLRSHKIRKHSPDKVTCKRCTRAFINQEHHDAHSCKLFIRICPICGKEFNNSSKMARHMHSHADKNRFKCDRCPATYKTRYALKVHIDRHDGNRTNKCEYCDAKFYSLSVLIKHRRVHTGEKPYVCKTCNKGFTGMHNLKVHMQIHGEYTIVRRNKNMEDEDNKNDVKLTKAINKLE